MVVVAQLVRALDCGSRGRGFKSHLPPTKNEKPLKFLKRLFIFIYAKEIILTIKSLQSCNPASLMLFKHTQQYHRVFPAV